MAFVRAADAAAKASAFEMACYLEVGGATALLSYGHDMIVRCGRVPVNMLDEIERG